MDSETHYSHAVLLDGQLTLRRTAIIARLIILCLLQCGLVVLNEETDQLVDALYTKKYMLAIYGSLRRGGGDREREAKHILCRAAALRCLGSIGLYVYVCMRGVCC